MMEIALGLLACAVFATLAAVAVTAALKSARVDNIIGEVFSPWIQEPSAATDAALRSPAETPKGQAADAAATGRPATRA